MAQLPTGVSIVTAADEEGPIGCTVNSFMSLSADPPAVLVSLAQASRTLTDIVRTGGFGVNVLSWGQRALCRRFARGDPHRRFDGVPHVIRDAVPLLLDAAAVLTCRLQHTVELGDHTLLIGAPTSAACDPRVGGLALHRRCETLIEAPKAGMTLSSSQRRHGPARTER